MKRKEFFNPAHIQAGQVGYRLRRESPINNVEA